MPRELENSIRAAAGASLSGHVASPRGRDSRASTEEPLRPGVLVRASCRSCKTAPLETVLSLGNQYVSNFVDSPETAECPRVPLEIVLCSGCGLVQLRHTTPPEWMYRRYWYKSGMNATMRAALADISHKAAELAGLRRGDAVLDIGCNDGTLLRSYIVPGIRRVGFEPAANLTKEASQGTDEIFPDYFDAAALGDERFKVITSIAMFYDLEDPNRFVADVSRSLTEDGVWVIEMHYLPQILARNAFDAICHEHLEYYALAPLELLLERQGLKLLDAETNDVNGGSLRAYVARVDGPAVGAPGSKERLGALRAAEKRLELNRPETYRAFGRRICRIGQRLRAFLEKEKARGRRISVYGASTKGNTLLQYFGLDRNLLDVAAERNPEKWRKYTVGTWIPIVSEADARTRTDDFLVLPWHFIEEMRARESEFLAKGGRLIVPLPEPRVLDAAGSHPLDDES